MVCPTQDYAAEALRHLAGVMPVGATMSGRTMLLMNHGKVSVVAAEDTPFTVPFDVLFLGWSTTKPGKEFLAMADWRAKATRVR